MVISVRTEQLRYFVETIHSGSINRAAEKLYVSQSTLFDALNKLEGELDIRLLNRSHSGVTVTAEGRLFYDIAVDFLDQLDDFQKIVHHVPDIFREQEVFSCFATPEMVDTVVPELLRSISKKYPSLRINLQVGDFCDAVQSVREGKVEFALILIHRNILLLPEMQAMLCQDDLAYDELARTKVMITVSRESSLARKKEISIKEVLKLPAVIYKTDIDPTWHKKAYQTYGEMNVFFISGNWTSCDWYTSTHREMYGFTSKASPIKTTNKHIPIKEDIFYSALVVHKRSFMLANFVHTVIKDICERYIAD